MKCYLRYQGEYLAQAEACRSISEAKHKFQCAAQQLAGFGQRIEATIHIPRAGELHEYPDYALSLGDKGNIKRERC